jgi:hypothetical protein
MPSHHKFGAVGAGDGRGVPFSISVAHSTGLLKAAMNDPTNAPQSPQHKVMTKIRNRLAPHHLVSNPDLLDTQAGLRHLRIDR